MTDDDLRAVAMQAGLAPRWTDNDGREQTVAVDVLRAALTALGLPAHTPDDVRAAAARLRREQEQPQAPALATCFAGQSARIAGARARSGFARLEVEQGGACDLALADDDGGLRLPPVERIGYHRLLLDDAEITLAVAPHAARSLHDVGQGGKMWGLAAQIYGFRGETDCGFGHFGDVGAFAESAARRGADMLALSPAHALFLADENHYTPYSPSSRLFYNALFADPAIVFGAERVAAAMAFSRGDDGAGSQDDAGETLIDWPRASQARVRLLRALYAQFRNIDIAISSSLAQDFARFRAAGGAALQAHAVFEALHAREYGRAPSNWSWRAWAPELRDADSPAVRAFARDNDDEVAFHVFAQWLVDRSMARAQGRALTAGMRIGLVSDLAIGMNSGGSHAWSRPRDLLLGLSIGAPPDMLAPLGQDWGLTTFSPRALRATGYAPFLATLRAALRNAGGVRIDHVLGLVRLWLVPDGAQSTDGVYLSYPTEDLIALINLESARHRAIVIGEDLGTAPHGLRDRLAQAGIAGMRILQFEREGDRFKPPHWYPEGAVAMTGTHDTATIVGWWRGADILAREQAAQLPPGRTRADCEGARARERQMVWSAFVEAGAADAAAAPDVDTPAPALDGALRFIARTPARLVVLPLEDALGLEAQPNLPGTTTEHPNWRRRYPGRAGAMLDAPEASARLAMVAERRN